MRDLNPYCSLPPSLSIYTYSMSFFLFKFISVCAGLWNLCCLIMKWKDDSEHCIFKFSADFILLYDCEHCYTVSTNSARVDLSILCPPLLRWLIDLASWEELPHLVSVKWSYWSSLRWWYLTVKKNTWKKNSFYPLGVIIWHFLTITREVLILTLSILIVRLEKMDDWAPNIFCSFVWYICHPEMNFRLCPRIVNGDLSTMSQHGTKLPSGL